MNHPHHGRPARSLRVAIATCLLLATAVPGVSTPVGARSVDDTAELKSLDARLMPSFLTTLQALDAMGDDINDLAARSLLSQAARKALVALDTTDVRECFRDWHALTRTAFWLLSRSVDLIGAYDQAVLVSDNGARDAAMTEFSQTIRPGVSLFYYVPVARQQVHCTAPASRPPSGPHGQVATTRYAD
jgi:hypothetical protein